MISAGEMMGSLSVEDILKATGGRLLFGRLNGVSGISIDSRTIKPGELFLAIRGENFDGHDFVQDAMKTGAGAIVSVPPAEPVRGKIIIHVMNTIRALHDIARDIRRRLGVPVVGITGTNGKTTTKELIASVFGVSNKVLKTTGNLNNHIGMPLCITRTKWDESALVLEMGSNRPGDIRDLCRVGLPDFAVVTNVGPAHLEGFGSIDMVRKTDLEILDFVKTAVVNADDAFLMEGLSGYPGRLITYGRNTPADVKAEQITVMDKGSRFVIAFPDGERIPVTLAISGAFNISNALAAAAVTRACGVDLEDVRTGLESFTGVPMRLEISEFQGMLVICDVYNANPASMAEAVREMARLRRQRMVAALGDMLELGAFSSDAHMSLVNELSALGVDVLIAVGPEMEAASKAFPGTCYTAKDSVEAGVVLREILRKGDTVLIKGSRGMKMERVRDSIMGGEKSAL